MCKYAKSYKPIPIGAQKFPILMAVWCVGRGNQKEIGLFVISPWRLGNKESEVSLLKWNSAY